MTEEDLERRDDDAEKGQCEECEKGQGELKRKEKAKRDNLSIVLKV